MNVFYFPPKNSICYENGHKKMREHRPNYLFLYS